jgi:hypothetical protein
MVFVNRSSLIEEEETEEEKVRPPSPEVDLSQQPRPVEQPPLEQKDEILQLVQDELARRKLQTKEDRLIFKGSSANRDAQIKEAGLKFKEEQNIATKELLRRQFIGSDIETVEPFGRIGSKKETRIPNAREKALFFGLSLEGAPASVRAAQGFGDELLGPQAGLGEQFGVFFDPEIEEVVFVDKKTGEKRLVNRPGIDPGDFAQLAPELLPLGAEVGAFLVTLGATKSVQLGILAGAAGAFAGEKARLKTGKHLGFNDFSNDEINARAGLFATISLVAGEAGIGINNVVQILRSRGYGPFKNIVDLEALEEGAKIATQRAENVAATTGEAVKPRTAQALREADPEAAAILEGAETALIRRTPGAAPLRESRTAQKKASERVRQRILPEEEPIPTGREISLGKTIQKEAAKAPTESIEEAQRRIVVRADRAQKATERLGLPPKIAEAGETVQEVLFAGRQNIRKGFSDRFDEIRGTLRVTADISEAIKLGKSKLKSIQGLVFKEAGGSELGGFERDLVRLTGLNDPTMGLNQLQDNIMTLRASKRALQKAPGVPNKVIKDIDELEASLLSARADALANNPELAREIAQLESEFFVLSEEIERGAIGRIVDRISPTRFRLSNPNRVINEIIGNPTEARRIAAALDKDIFAKKFAGTQASIRDAIFSRYKTDVIDRTGKFSIPAHNAFFSKFEDGIRPFLSKKELSALKRAGSSQKFLKEVTRKEEALIRQINTDEAFNLNLRKWDPLEVTDKIFSLKSPAKTKQILSLLSGHSEKLADFKRIFRQRVRDSVIKPNRNMTGEIVDARRLTQMLMNNRERESIILALGKEYLNGLRAVRDLEVLTARVDAAQQLPETATRFASNIVTDALRGLGFTPLTAKGRGLTASLRFGRRSTLDAMAKLLDNPEAMLRAGRIRALRSGRLKANIALFSEVGAFELAQDLSEANTNTKRNGQFLIPETIRQRITPGATQQ